MKRSNRAWSIAARALAATAAVTLLALALGCGDDDGSGPTGPSLSTNEMVEVSSGVAVSTIVSLSSLASAIPGLGDGGALKMGRARGPLAIALDMAHDGLTKGTRRTATGERRAQGQQRHPEAVDVMHEQPPRQKHPAKIEPHRAHGATLAAP